MTVLYSVLSIEVICPIVVHILKFLQNLSTSVFPSYIRDYATDFNTVQYKIITLCIYNFFQMI